MSWWRRLLGVSGGASGLTSTDCAKCGESVDEGWECTKCREVYCESCGGESESSSTLSQQHMSGLGNVMVLDLTQPDKGPACPRCKRELKKWRRPPQAKTTQATDTRASAGPSELPNLLKGVPAGRQRLLTKLHKHLSRMRSVNINEWFASKGRNYGPREPFDVMDEFFDSADAVVAELAGRDDLVNITFNSDSCIVEFDSIAKLYALLRDPDDRFYWWNIWQR